MLLEVSGTLSADWSDDSTAFFVEDHLASDSTRTYLYPISTLQRLDVAALILAADPLAERFVEGHAYFSVDRWDGSQYLLIHLYGHTDQAPVDCFDLHYRVNRNGAVQKQSQQVRPVAAKSCQG
jgi:hypothetical protein